MCFCLTVYVEVYPVLYEVMAVFVATGLYWSIYSIIVIGSLVVTLVGPI